MLLHGVNTLAQSTFQGPVRSLNGFISQGPGTVISLAAASLTVDPAVHGGRMIYVNYTAGACTITLPTVDASADSPYAGPGSDPSNTSNIGVVYTFFIAATNTNGIKIRTTSSTPGDLFIGSALLSTSAGTPNLYLPNGSSNDVISMNGTTTGGIAGSYLTVQAVAANKYLVNGVLVGSGTLATPFADA